MVFLNIMVLCMRWVRIRQSFFSKPLIDDIIVSPAFITYSKNCQATYIYSSSVNQSDFSVLYFVHSLILLGYALFMEGVMSACYHVCPNYSNFQFGKCYYKFS